MSTREILEEYFYDLANNSKVFVCVTQNDAGKHAVYVEKDGDDIECMVFLSKLDAFFYKDIVCDREKFDDDTVKIWESKVPDFIDFMVSLKTKYKKKGKTVTAKTNIIREGKLVEIDVFWSSDESFMV